MSSFASIPRLEGWGSGQQVKVADQRLSIHTLEAGGRIGGDFGRWPESDVGNSSPSLSSQKRLGGMGGFTLSFAFPPRGFLYDPGFGTFVNGWKTY